MDNETPTAWELPSEQTGQLTSEKLEEIYQELKKHSVDDWTPVYDPDAVQDARGCLHLWAENDDEINDLIAKMDDNAVMFMFSQIAFSNEDDLSPDDAASSACVEKT